MSITVQLNLPDTLVKEARDNGLLESESLTDLLSNGLRRRKAAAGLGKVLDDIRAQPGEPMSQEEIQAEVDAVRAERRAVKLVVDTNTIISGSLWQGPPARLISAVLGGQAQMFLSLPLLLELRETLQLQSSPGDWRDKAKPPGRSPSVFAPPATKPCPPELFRLPSVRSRRCPRPCLRRGGGG